MNRDTHGEAGHLNVLVRDQDSYVTSFGKHCRLVVGVLVEGGDVVCREDIKWDLPLSTESQRRKVIRAERLIGRGARLVHHSSERYESSLGHEAIEHIYKVIR